MWAFTFEQSNATIMKRKPYQRGLNYLKWQRKRKSGGAIWLHRLHSSCYSSCFSEEFYLNKGEHSNDYVYKTKYRCSDTCTNKSNGILMHKAGIDYSVYYC